MLDLQARQLQRVEVISREVHEVIEQEDTGISLLSPAGFSADGVLVSHLFDALRGLQAARWVASTDDGTFDLAEPQAQVKLIANTAHDQTQEHRFAHWGEHQGRVLCRARWRRGVWCGPSAVRVNQSVGAGSFGIFGATGSCGAHRVERGGSFARSWQGWRPLQSRGHRGAIVRVRRSTNSLTNCKRSALRRRSTWVTACGGRVFSATLTLVAKDPSGAQRVGWKIGAADVWRNISIYYGRVEGVNATFVFARGPIERVLGTL